MKKERITRKPEVLKSHIRHIGDAPSANVQSGLAIKYFSAGSWSTPPLIRS